ncbi:dihydrolipoyl dehydrogenase [Desulfuromonas versatilis]|uniref:Dihydrolipoyl dehydrogenase n=1 Tax=Desulfuromonas versatilis TaxID=2802975 RepID=A0ABM8HQJ9_9BACT|nr:dihydrolipoyl dehydrogenase [Desulfuromonas versatilis]BCR04101.1 dihydrolipoyl dehydrogenase [Desulfuromonas versatilis]
MIEFDLAVIGAGPGGYVAAIRGVQKGAKVCVIEEDKVGGTCLNRGCIPTKALCSTAHTLERIRHAAAHGILVEEPRIDYALVAERKDKIVATLVGGIEQLLKGNGIEVFRGRGSIEGPGRVKIRCKDVVGHIRAKQIILATGSVSARPKALPIDGKNILTSDEILAIKELPKSLLIIGGGYIGCEFASIFGTLGTEVTLVEQLPQLLSYTDRQAVRELEKAFRESGVKVHTGTSVESLEVGDGAVSARLSSGETLNVEKALVAVGRVPNSAGLGLEEAGIKVEKGAVVVDERLRTSLENVYAIGDVTGGIQLAHVASYQAAVAVDNALGGDVRVDYSTVPSVIFTLPEIAQVGLTEEQCKEKGLAYRAGRFAYQASGKALCDGEPRGSVKVLAAEADGRILGAVIAGNEASSLISEISTAMHNGLSVAELAHAIHAHPTLPEMIMEAAEDCEGVAVHKVSRKTRERASSKN